MTYENNGENAAEAGVAGDTCDTCGETFAEESLIGWLVERDVNFAAPVCASHYVADWD